MSDPLKNECHTSDQCDGHIGELHPGAMGASLAAALVKVGYRVYWASENRSVESVQRATAYKLHDRSTLASLCKECNDGQHTNTNRFLAR